MAMTWDLTDIPAVDAADLAAAMRSLIEDGRGLVLLNGASEADLDTARAALQSRHHAEPQRALAAFVRFRHLVEVFGARRLKDLMLDNGYALMAPAIAIASSSSLKGIMQRTGPKISSRAMRMWLWTWAKMVGLTK